ncbi:ABC transporter ATP-binding protein [bacterium CG_4_9_14_3_um_filter_65_15]|nr:MAG: ABC transporter ATP-binding protein [bacterium CG_4_9_14_3_um_filter_65_15]
MNTYGRMLRMIRPYLGQVVLSIVFMVLFSVLSVLSITMVSPFLKALFLSDGPATEMVSEQVPASGLALAQVAADSTDAARARLEDIQGTLSWVERIKVEFATRVQDTLLQGSDEERLLRVCWAIFLLFLGKNIAGYLQEILMTYVGQAVIRDLRNLLFIKFTGLPLGFYHRNKAGELISRATNDVLVAQQCVSLSFTKLVKDPIMILMYLAVALILSWKLTLMAGVLLPLSLAVIVRIGKRLRRLSTLQQEQMADLTSTLQETVYGIRVIKAFAMEDFENRKFLGQSQTLFGQIFKFNWVMKLSSPLTEQLSIIVGLCLLWYGGTKVFTGGIMAPDLFVVFLIVIFSMVRPIKSLGQVNNEIQAGMAAADRIFAILDSDPEVADKDAGFLPGKIAGQVELEHVSFAYVAGEPVLQDVSLQVAPGEIVALVGSSGSGKSTLIDMIPGFHHPDAGRVLVDEHDVREMNTGALRRSMGIVTQEVILFHDTVFNNIAYGLREMGQDQVEAAARAANAHDFIMRLPKGYRTVIGDRGLKLSGGQRQRISIARAILKNPPILLLDEATSALDTESELLVQEAIDRLVRHRTTIVIAHRLSTIQNVDRIYMLEEGRIVQVGTHTELLASGGRYRELYEMQFQQGAS